ncbi:unnamed protein product [Xylocopa violacea]|uniref:Protein Abitram n=1 Tax=Xylocopa violacea TaxID=135666 RepID=A0ABP1NWB6_XYLVO
MNINSDNNEPITKKNKSNDINNDSCIILKEENNTDENFECQENTDLTDNEDEGMPLSNNDEDDSLFPFPPDTDITDMLEGVNYHGSFPTITERYFTAYYKLDVQSPADDICVLMHSNRICMLTLAPSHTVFQNKDITKVDFKVSDKLDRILNKVSDGKTHTIKCCIIGKLVEVNEALLQNPKLLLEPPHKGGYLAIVLPNIKLLDKMKKSLLTQEQYDLKILERQNATNHLETSKICEKSNSEMINNETKLNENKSQITLSTTS